MKKLIRILTILAAMLFFSTQGLTAVVATSTGVITYIENGWAGEGFAIRMTNTVTTSGCSAPAHEYGISATHPAYNILVAMMMSAYSKQTPIQLVVDQGVCVLGQRTKILSIRVGS